MLPQAVAERLLKSIPAHAGAVSVWPWHEDGGGVTMVVVIDPSAPVDTRYIPSSFLGFPVRVERRSPPVIMSA